MIVISHVTFEKSLFHPENVYPVLLGFDGAVAHEPYVTDHDEMKLLSRSSNVTVYALIVYSAVTVKSHVTFEKSAFHQLNVYPVLLGSDGAVAHDQ